MIKDENLNSYTIVYDWMTDTNYLGLDFTTAGVFAIIYSFTKSKAGCYYGSRDYIAKKVGKSNRTVTTIVNRLVDANLVSKAVRMEGCIKHNTLTANIELVENINEKPNKSRGKKLQSTREKTSLATREKTSLNKKAIDNKVKHIKTNTNVLVGETPNSPKQINSNQTVTRPLLSECVSDTDMNGTVTNTNDLGLKDNVLFSSKKKKTKKNRYEKCIDTINDFTEDEKLRECLVGYLNMILEKRRSEGKPLFANQFKGIVKKLNTVPKDDWIESVQIATCKGWSGFYPVNRNNNYAGNSMRQFSESTQSNSNMETEEERQARLKWAEEMAKNGEQTVF